MLKSTQDVSTKHAAQTGPKPSLCYPLGNCFPVEPAYCFPAPFLSTIKKTGSSRFFSDVVRSYSAMLNRCLCKTFLRDLAFPHISKPEFQNIPLSNKRNQAWKRRKINKDRS